MFKKLVFIVILLAGVAGLAACGGGNRDKPESIVISFFNAAEKNDPDGVAKMFYIADAKESDQDIMESKLPLMVKSMHETITDHNGIDSIKTEKVYYTDDKKAAIVYITVTYKDGQTHSERFHTTYHDGKWLLTMHIFHY